MCTTQIRRRSPGGAARNGAGAPGSVNAVTAEVCLDDLDSEGLLALAGETLRRLGADPLAAAVDDEALAATVRGLDRLERMAHGEKLRRIAALDDRGAHHGRAPSTADWLAPHLGLSPAEAKAQADAAGALQRLPKTAQRLRAGQLGVGQAHQAARSLTELDHTTPRGTADDQAAGRLDDHVAGHGPDTTRTQLRQSIDRLHHDHDPALLAERQRRAHARRNAWITNGPDGDVRFGGTLDAAGGAHLRAAIDALSRPAGRNEHRSPAQRRADAFVDLARRNLDAGGLPEMAAQGPHVIAITTNDALDAVPDAPASWLDGYGTVPSATARMLACNATVTEVVVDGHGRPLQVRETGRPNRRQRRAAIARDRHCIGCGAPASQCQLHHIVWRRNKGATVVENLVLVCWACHHGIHHAGWTVVRTADGRYTINRAETADQSGAADDLLRHPA